MTEQETWKIVYVLKASYLNQFKDYTTADFENLVSVWKMMFEDYTYEDVSAGLRLFLANDTKGFAPNPGQVIDCILKITKPETAQLSEGEAWHMVRKAIEKGTYYAESEFEKFPEAVKRAVGSPSNLRSIASSDNYNEGAEKNDFERKYRAYLQREREEAKIPKKIKQLIATTAMQIELKGDKE